ncbi:MAG: hypothetical protein BYD32DRAFT_125730 [Podila humilis]|nr:MAG: hypothetical protein BYD32DRAFT_125730 [Podila humilis]
MPLLFPPLPMRSAVTQGRCQQPTTQLHNNKQRRRITLCFACQCMMHAIIETPRHSLSSFFFTTRLHFPFFYGSFSTFISYHFTSLASLPFPSLPCGSMSPYCITCPFGRVFCFVYRFLQTKRQKGIRTGDPTWIVHISSSLPSMHYVFVLLGKTMHACVSPSTTLLYSSFTLFSSLRPASYLKKKVPLLSSLVSYVSSSFLSCFIVFFSAFFSGPWGLCGSCLSPLSVLPFNIGRSWSFIIILPFSFSLCNFGPRNKDQKVCST